MTLLIFFSLCFLAGICAASGWLKLASDRQWFDYPNQRSSHSWPTPKGGGVGFALVFFVMLVTLQRLGIVGMELVWLCVPGLCLTAAGLCDDLRELGILLRLCLQGLAVAAALFVMPGLPVIEFPSLALSAPALLLLMLGLGWIWLINLYNFMDGIDGLAASEGIYVALALGWFGLEAGMHGSSLLMLGLAAILAGFLVLNWAPARLFMGDAGSNFLGYVLAAYGLVLAQAGAITVWTLLILLAVFIIDSTATLVKRMRAKAVWYHGHRSHAYQLEAGARRSHSIVVGGIMGINVLWLLPLAWLSIRLPEWGLGLMLVASIPVLLLVNCIQRKYLTEGMQ
jgi:Fuc2NAc and GlcNAc transferase